MNWNRPLNQKDRDIIQAIILACVIALVLIAIF